ncbi:septation protein SepH [Sanguibacter suarezii]|uniref:septation protein SepH n=1 Tax=Sanguibacter suarezii TaxID=60921 RepID=UPI00082D8D83|nr:septation protein SepH [Sanguibacter suarezii]
MVELNAGELRLVGLHDDGEHLVLAGPGGKSFQLPITDALRAAVRGDRPRLEHLKSQSAGALPPREIQARVRAGKSAEEIAEESGITVAQVRRYEGPVLAERAFIAQQAAATRVGRDNSSPSLGDLVTDRLAARGVDTETLEWDAARPDGHGWIVTVTFLVGGAERIARWTFDAPARSLHALEDEARWLSETEIADEPIPRRHLASVRASVFDVEADGSIRPVLDAVDSRSESRRDLAPVTPDPREAALDQTSALLDDLRGRRGVRQQMDIDEESGFEGFGPPSTFNLDTPPAREDDVPGAHPAGGDDRDARVYSLPAQPALPADGATTAPATGAGPQAPDTSGSSEPQNPNTTDATTGAADAKPAEPAAEAAPADADPAKPRSSRRARSKVPSWDEIVFGAKPE